MCQRHRSLPITAIKLDFLFTVYRISMYSKTNDIDIISSYVIHTGISLFQAIFFMSINGLKKLKGLLRDGINVLSYAVLADMSCLK